MSEEKNQHSPLAWAAYLGASWTWCIGMFLPVLLIRDYGPWAWVIFAVPNCLGAAAMGWVMRSREQSIRYVNDHRFACNFFSAVTISFQIFFAFWMMPRLLGEVGYFVALIVAAIALFPILGTRKILLWAMFALGTSVLVGLFLASRGSLQFPQPLTVRPENLLGLALVCLLGFAACPYLDLTFHHARQQTNEFGAKIAFGIGFCVFFLAMIVLTLFYASTFVRMAGISTVLLAAHLALQLTFTVYVHSTSLRESEKPRGVFNTQWAAGAIVIGVLAGILGDIAWHDQWVYHGLALGEVIYRMLMAFYGLIFPTYVLLAIKRNKIYPVIWLAIVCIAMPFYWLAFIEARMAWAIGGVGIVIAGVLLDRLLKSPAPVAPIERIALPGE